MSAINDKISTSIFLSCRNEEDKRNQYEVYEQPSNFFSFPEYHIPSVQIAKLVVPSVLHHLNKELSLTLMFRLGH